MTNTFKIGISPKILDKARNFFNSTTEDILNELLQNSRRAGATKVKVTKSVNDNTVIIEDNGIGIFNNGVAINLGGSSWSSKTQEKESPAGCGLFSLANLDSIIESHGKKVRLNAAAFNGAREVEIEESDFLNGTRITFRNDDNEKYFNWFLKKACKFYPVEVEYNGVDLDKPKDFLEDAVYVQEWEGLRIGVVKTYQRVGSVIKLNFYGLEINCPDRRRPYFNRVLDKKDLLIKIDIIDCSKLQLVLPSRKEVVSNDFLELLFQQCRKAVFNYFKDYCAAGGTHTLSYTLWLEAKNCFGIELPEAEESLIKWYPKTDEYHNEFCSEHVEVKATNVVVYNIAQENYEQHTLYRSLCINNKAPTLVFANKDYEGYSWYKSLPKLKEVETKLTYKGITVSLQEEINKDQTDLRPDCIELELVIETCGLDTTITLYTDLVLAGGEYCCDLYEAIIFLSKDSKIELEELVNVLTLCFFIPCEDSGSDSYETQMEYFSGEVWSLVRSLLLSEKEAALASIQEAVENHIRCLVPSGNRAVIKIQQGLVTVDLELLTENTLEAVKE